MCVANGYTGGTKQSWDRSWFLYSKSSSLVGWPTILVYPGLRGFPGSWTFSFKAGKVSGKLGGVGHSMLGPQAASCAAALLPTPGSLKGGILWLDWSARAASWELSTVTDRRSIWADLGLGWVTYGGTGGRAWTYDPSCLGCLWRQFTREGFWEPTGAEPGGDTTRNCLVRMTQDRDTDGLKTKWRRGTRVVGQWRRKNRPREECIWGSLSQRGVLWPSAAIHSISLLCGL